VESVDLPITFDLKEKMPVYRQLSQALRDAIRSGRLKAGEHLPSTREMAEMLGIARATVVKSYEQLLSQGYLQATTGAGTFVSRQLPREAAVDESLRAEEQEHRAEHVEQALSSYAQRLMQMPLYESTSDNSADFDFGAPTPELLPARQWRETLNKYYRLQEPQTLEFSGDIFGYRPLREAVASFLARSRSLNCHPDQIVVFFGAQGPVNHIVRLLVEPGDQAVVENPGYVGAREQLLAQGAHLTAVPIDSDGLVVDSLPNAQNRAKLVYVTPSFHDPTGIIMSLKRRKELLAWARRAGAMVVEDAWDSDFRYVNPALPALQGMDDNDCVFYIYSFWKMLYPLSMASFLVIPRSYIPLFARAKLLTERQYPPIDHYALTDFITEGHLERHIKKTRSNYGKQRQALIFALTQRFRKSIIIPKQSAGMHISIRLETPLSDEDVAKCARRAGLPLVSTAEYYVEKPATGEFVIPFTSCDTEALTQRVNRFADGVLLTCG
jgi:GntR family transcriptional regulator / MocR family aminotransferase